METTKASIGAKKRFNLRRLFSDPPARQFDRGRRIAAAVALLGKTRSSKANIVARLRSLKAKFRQYLRQDEFGPTRPQRSATLLKLENVLDAVDSSLEDTPPRLAGLMAARLPELKSSRHDGVEFEAFERERESLERILDAASFLVASNALTTREAAQARRLQRLSQKAQLIWEGLGAESAVDLALARIIFGEDQFLSGAAESDDLAALRGQIRRFKKRVKLTLRALNRVRGPNPRVTLGWFVQELADLYAYETGERVTSNPRRGWNYLGVPQTPAGAFIVAVLEAMLPRQVLKGDKDFEVPHAAAIFLAGRPDDRARAVNSILADYVRRHRS